MFAELIYNEKNIPIANVTYDGKAYPIPLVHGVAICYFNQILKAQNTGIEIKFESYPQYAQLLRNVSEALQKKKPLLS